MNTPNIELCCKCGCPTGRSGKNEDSLFLESREGPYCSECFDKMSKPTENERTRGNCGNIECDFKHEGDMVACDEWTPKSHKVECAEGQSDYKAVPEMRGTEQIGVTFERRDATLLPCPFCGSIELTCNGHSVECDICRAEGPCVHPVPDGNTARKMWNSRKPTAQDVLAVLEDDGLVALSAAGVPTISLFQERLNAINAYRNAVRERVVHVNH